MSSVDYIFVPLAAELHTGQQIQPVIISNTRRYLRAQRTDSVWALALVDYIRENSAAPAPSGTRWLARFTGARLRYDLDHGQAYVRHYRNGQVAPGVGTAARYICQDYYTCTWTAVCQDARGNYYINGATTYGYGNCDSPQQEACGTDTWGRSWYRTGSKSDRVCVNDDGDPVDPNDPSGGGPTDPTTTPPTPCDRIKSLTAANNSLYNSSLARLRSLVVNPPRGSRGEPLETGITFTDPDDI